jgi:hypothetical protein
MDKISHFENKDSFLFQTLCCVNLIVYQILLAMCYVRERIAGL